MISTDATNQNSLLIVAMTKSLLGSWFTFFTEEP